MGVELIFKYFTNLSMLQKQSFEAMFDVYKHWNAKINLISRKDIDNLYMNHVLPCLSIAKVLNFSYSDRVIDIGTGGGFPGIPLAIMFPDVNFHLIDSIGKKIDVTKQIAKELMLSNVTTEVGRAENIRGHYSFVTGRAVCNLQLFYSLTRHLLKPGNINGGMLYLKGGDGKIELAEADIKFQAYELNDLFAEEGNLFFGKVLYWVK
jgi:16S rRNA (guanine527-N7)-methyltransferase